MRANVGLAFIKRPKIFQITYDAAVNMEDFMFTSLTQSFKMAFHSSHEGK